MKKILEFDNGGANRPSLGVYDVKERQKFLMHGLKTIYPIQIAPGIQLGAMQVPGANVSQRRCTHTFMLVSLGLWASGRRGGLGE